MSRPLGPGLVQGAARGAIAGLVLMAPVAFFLLLATSGREVLLVIESFAVLLGTAALGAGDALSARLTVPARQRLARGLAGFVAPYLTVMPAFGITRPAGISHTTDFFLVLVIISPIAICLAIGQLAAGTPQPGATPTERLRRAARASLAGGGVWAAFAFVVVVWRDGFGTAFGAAIGYLIAFLIGGQLLAIGHLLAAPIGRRLARLLEGEEAGSPLGPRGRYDDQVATWNAAYQAALAAGPQSGRAHLERASEHALAALEIVRQDDRLTLLRPQAARRAAEAQLLLCRRALDPIVADLPEAETLRAEAHRVSGDPEGAAARARGALAFVDELPAETRGLVLASAHAVLALALADLGRFDESQQSLEALKTLEGEGDRPSLARFKLDTVMRLVEKRRARPAPPVT